MAIWFDNAVENLELTDSCHGKMCNRSRGLIVKLGMNLIHRTIDNDDGLVIAMIDCLVQSQSRIQR
jgi:hypothetical protein